MLIIDGKQFRNLQEQVQKNKEDIARHYEIDRTLANLGIKVVGQVSTAAELPDPLTYNGDYGDAYAVGVKADVDAGTATYDYYVFTRPDPNTGEPDDHWLNVGKISIEGPQGPQGIQGEQGPQGERGSLWFFGYTNTPTLPNARVNDLYVNMTNGTVYQITNTNPLMTQAYGSIQGPQGPQGMRGPQGIQGEVGPIGPVGPQGSPSDIYQIIGILSNANQLPAPTALNNIKFAYLIGTQSPYNLYIQIGENIATATWNNVGPFDITMFSEINLENGSGLNSLQQKGSIAQGDYSMAIAVGETHGRYSFAVGSGSIAGWTEEEFNTKFPNGVDSYGNAYSGVGVQYFYDEYRAFSIALGRESIAKGKASLASGYSSIAEGNNSTAINGGKVYGDDSFAGCQSIVNGDRSFAYGNGNTLNGTYGAALGINNRLTGYNDTALGSSNTISGTTSIALGEGHNITSNFGTAIGRTNKISGPYGFAGGYESEANGTGSFAFGLGKTKATGYNSFSIGYGSEASNSTSISIGTYIKNSIGNKTAVGVYNYDNPDTVFEVGNGTSEANRKNAFEVYRDGTVKGGKATSASDTELTLVTKSYVDALIARIEALENK